MSVIPHKIALPEQRSTISALRREIGCALVEARREWQFWTVLAIATIVMAIMQYNVPLWYFGGDHSDYYWYARYLLGDGIYPIPPNWRTPGMGLFHIASGTVILDTWKGFIALFAAFSVAIPVLFFLIVKPHSRNFALLAGVVVIVSMTPYIYATMAGSDQLYFFLHALFLFMCVAYFHRRLDQRLALPVGIAVVAAYSNMVRPVGAVLFWIFILIAAVLRWRDWRRLLAASGVYIALMAGWIVWDREYGTNAGLGPGLGFPLANELATTAERRFAQAYFSPHGLLHAGAGETDLPNTATLRATVRSFLAEHPDEWRQHTPMTPASLFGDLAHGGGSADALLDALFTQPNTLYFGFIVSAAKKSLGGDRALELIHAAAAEHGATGLAGLLQFCSFHPTHFLFGVTPNLGGRSLFAGFFRANENSDRTWSRNEFPDQLLTDEPGPANALILRTVRQVIDGYIQFTDYWPPGISAQFRDQPGALYTQVIRDDRPPMLRQQGLEPEQLIYNILNWYFGPDPTGRIYGRAATEIVKSHPNLLTLQLDNFMHLTGLRRYMGHELTWNRDVLAQESDAYGETRVQVVSDLTPGLRRELVPVAKANDVFKTAAALHSVVYAISPVFLLLLVFALPFLRGAALLAPCLILLGDYAYQLLGITVFSPWGAPRYEAAFYLLPLIVSCMIFGEFMRRRSKKVRAARAS